MKHLVSTILIICSVLPVFSQTVSFPGAEGYGSLATGGRGGSVYHVTTLNDSGPGTFRDAVSQPKRTVVFDLSGIIQLKSRVSVASDITIAGQTAPDEGIVLYGNGVSFSNAKNIIARYLRFHGSINMPKGSCVVVIDNADNIILDHCSITWGRWDNLHIKESSNVTLQYCLNGESIDPQRFGALLENPTNLTIHHCLWADNQSRNPKAKAAIQLVNNVVYNYGGSGMVGGHSAVQHYQDIIGNYFIAGPNSSDNYLSMFTETDHVYQKGNYRDLNKDGLLNGVPVTKEDFINEKAALEAAPHNISPGAVTIDSASDAYAKVLAQAGASITRDQVDARIIDQLKSLGTKGKIIRSEAEVGGQGPVKSVKAFLDSDKDGIPDAWEKAHRLNPKNAEDANTDPDKNGYTNLEEYINSIPVR